MITFSDRSSDSPFVERVWRSSSNQGGPFCSIAACHWELVVIRHEGKSAVIVRGPETKATTAECPSHGDWFAIRFKLGTFMPSFLPGDLRDRNDVPLPAASSRSFWLNGSAVEYPSFENAETFVSRLVRSGIIAADPVVNSVLREDARSANTRNEQRRFLRATGLTHGAVRQIGRARRATHLLRKGHAPLDVVYQTGYYDQAHFNRSLRRFIGQSPTEIIAAKAQLSFLYNTGET
jgi:hypothetical protein